MNDQVIMTFLYSALLPMFWGIWLESEAEFEKRNIQAKDKTINNNIYYMPNNFLPQLILQITIIEDITRWREDMIFIFEWQNNIIFTNEHSKWVKYCFCLEKIKFISSSRRVMFFLLHRQKDR